MSTATVGSSNAATFTPGPWRRSLNNVAVVSDVPVKGGPIGSDAVEYYGGHLIAESLAPRNAFLISAAPELYEALRYILDAELSYLHPEHPSVLRVTAVLAKAEGRS